MLDVKTAVAMCLQDRCIIDDALTREVVRVHRQLQHAALQLKGPAQLPALQAWDAAFSQVSCQNACGLLWLEPFVELLLHTYTQ
jgi:hypothetical protein